MTKLLNFILFLRKKHKFEETIDELEF